MFRSVDNVNRHNSLNGDCLHVLVVQNCPNGDRPKVNGPNVESPFNGLHRVESEQMWTSFPTKEREVC